MEPSTPPNDYYDVGVRVTHSNSMTITSGQILSESFRVFGANFLPFVAIMTLCVLPAIALSITGAVMREENLIVSGLLLNMFLALPAQAAMVYGTVQYMAGEETSPGESIRKGLSSMLAVLGTGLAMLFIVFLGFCSLFFPGIIFLMIYYVAIPAAVIERKGVSKSLQRSSALTEGVRWKIFGATSAVFFLNIICTLALQGILQLALKLNEQTWQVVAAKSVFEVTFAALGATMSAVVYVQLRKKHDSVDADDLTDVFA